MKGRWSADCNGAVGRAPGCSWVFMQLVALVKWSEQRQREGERGEIQVDTGAEFQLKKSGYVLFNEHHANTQAS